MCLPVPVLALLLLSLAASSSGRPPLLEPSHLSALVRAAPLVFSGRVARVLLPSGREVLSLQMDAGGRAVTVGDEPASPGDEAAVLLVDVRTMLKGRLPGQAPPAEPTDYLFPRVTVEVAVHGGGSVSEASTLRVLHTALFLARPDGARLRLFGRPLPMALRYLDVVRAAAADMTYSPRPPATEEPCERLQCPWGADCEQAGGRATCRCPDACPAARDADAAPACGTDGRTYASLCELRASACRRRDDTRLAHHGPCDDTEAFADTADETVG